MEYWVTDLTKPIPVEEFDGQITLLEAKFWPDWQEHPENMATYNWKSTPHVTRSVDLKSGKTYTLQDMLDHFNTQINAAAASVDLIATLRSKDGYVRLRVLENTQLDNLKFNKKMADILRFSPKSNGSSTEPIDLDSKFNNTRTLFLECQQIDETYVNDRETKTLHVIPVSPDGSITADIRHPVVATYRNNFVKKLTFRVHDDHGNDLPIKQALLHFTINDECVSRKNLP